MLSDTSNRPQLLGGVDELQASGDCLVLAESARAPLRRPTRRGMSAFKRFWELVDGPLQGHV